MWFNILPPLFIIIGSLGLPGYGLYAAHYYFIGNVYRRNLNERWDRVMYQRDLRLHGHAYHLTDLEKALPPEDQKKDKKKKK